MKLMYQGETPIESTVRIKRRAWFKEVCWEAVGVIVTLAAFWAFIILKFCM